MLRRLTSLLNFPLSPLSPTKWQPFKQWIPVWQRKKLVGSIDRSVDLDIGCFPEISSVAVSHSGKGLELQLSTLKTAWAQLLLTYGLKNECLQRFVSHHADRTAAQLPQCRLVMICRRYPQEAQAGPFMNDDFVRFASGRGVILDPEREPDEYPELHQLVVDFGRSVCEQYPVIFRDLYLLHVRNISPFVRDMQKRQNFVDPWPRRDRERNQTLLKYLEDEKNLDRWYRFTDDFFTQLLDCEFRFIRSLAAEPFDPIAQSDVIDPKVQLEAWEQAGMFAAAPIRVQFKVESGAVPSPIIRQLIPGGRERRLDYDWF